MKDDPLARYERMLLAAIALLAGLLLVRPVLSDPLGMAVGAQRSEAPRHFWGLWATAEHLLEWGPLVAHLEVDFPKGYTRHLMDPINLLFFLPGHLLGGGGVKGAVLGWNLMHLLWPMVGALGGWLLARQLLGTGPERAVARLLAALACGTAPYLMATPWLGRTEMMPGALWPLHLWLLHRALGPRRSIPDIVGAGLSLAGIALGGWYLAAWLMLLDPLVGLFFARQRGEEPGAPPWREQLVRLALIGGIAALPVLPALFALLQHPPPILGEDQRVASHVGISTPPWMLLPFSGSEGLPGTDLPAYPGAVLSLLAIWGALRHRAARPWLALAGGLLVLSLGPYLVFSVDPRELADGPLPLPAFFLEKLVPPLRFIWGWNRISILVTPPLAVAAAFGVSALPAALSTVRAQVLVVLLVGMAVDHARDRAPAGIQGSAFDPRPPAALLEAVRELPEGALLQLPFDDFYMTWQPGHGRPVAESLEIEQVRSRSWLVQQAEKLQQANGFDDPSVSALQGEEARLCLQQDGHALRELGFSAVVLHRDRLPERHLDLARFFTSGLGPPVVDGPTLAAWTLPATQPATRAETPVDCPVVEVTPVLGGPPAGPPGAQ